MTYLYIKRHKETGLKYFGKTIQSDPYKYLGSGVRWRNHINKHGTEHVETVWVEKFEDIDKLQEFAQFFSEFHDIANSPEWANLCHENGVDGGATREQLSEETRRKMSQSKLGTTWSEASKQKASRTRSGVKHSAEHIAKISQAITGKKHTEETKAKISAFKTGMKHTPEARAKITAAQLGKKQPLVECPHCHKIGGRNGMTRAHFNNCKNKGTV